MTTPSRARHGPGPRDPGIAHEQRPQQRAAGNPEDRPPYGRRQRPQQRAAGPGPCDPASTNDDAPPASTSLGPVSTDAAAHRLARTGTVVCLVVILLAVLWPSGGDVAQAKSILGLWFLSEADKDVVLNLVMLAPLTFLGALGWPRVPWWAWALLGCALGASAELTQLLVTVLDRRASWANVGQNAVGSWAGALAALAVMRLRVRRRTRG